MAKVCKSINEALALIRSAHSKSTSRIGKEMETKARKIVDEEVSRVGNGAYRTGASARAVTSSSNASNITITLGDGGHWSVSSGFPSVYLPNILESGRATYMPRGGLRGQTQMEKRITETAEKEAPNIYVRQMSALGIRAVRK